MEVGRPEFARSLTTGRETVWGGGDRRTARPSCHQYAVRVWKLACRQRMGVSGPTTGKGGTRHGWVSGQPVKERPVGKQPAPTALALARARRAAALVPPDSAAGSTSRDSGGGNAAGESARTPGLVAGSWAGDSAPAAWDLPARGRAGGRGERQPPVPTQPREKTDVEPVAGWQRTRQHRPQPQGFPSAVRWRRNFPPSLRSLSVL